ncbi:hypothetical protein OIU74_011762 [Salix koriyanagi]|uniref:Uncharacterized protein n=1 Tax=Salix koriyanagi TaxID=2511006 RepID=A0A9Q0TG06_9ROSI|nr:hypothetical protein OIU74_011762 [Salix koriyanagi]
MVIVHFIFNMTLKISHKCHLILQTDITNSN